MELNNEIAVPLYQQLEQMLKEEMDSGKRPVGSRIPTENELSQTYNVSRVTVRKALEKLSELGYIERKSGKGTFVAEKKIQRGLSGVRSFSEMCRISGLVPGAKTIKIALEEASERTIEKMHLDSGEKVLTVERIRYADEKPVLLEINIFPENCTFLFGESLNDVSLFEVLREKHHISFDHSTKIIDMTFASAQESKILNITKGYPLLRIDSELHTGDDSLIVLSRQLCIGDKFKIIV